MMKKLPKHHAAPRPRLNKQTKRSIMAGAQSRAKPAKVTMVMPPWVKEKK